MLSLLLLAIAIYANVHLASKKGLNPVLWGVVSFVAFFAAFMVATAVFMLNSYHGPIEGPEMKPAVQAWASSISPLSQLLLLMLGLGGCLLVRFILERKQVPK